MVQAGIIGTTGAATFIPTPSDASLDAITSNTQVYVWNEDQNVTLAAPLLVNAVAPGIYNTPASLASIPIPAGTAVASHYISFDAPPPEAPSFAIGTVTFDADIIGVIVLGDIGPTFLDLSDFLGSSTLYPDGVDARGIEISINDDNFGISPSHKTLSFDLHAAFPGDFIRVITLPVPAPATAPFLGAVGLLAMRRRRTRLS